MDKWEELTKRIQSALLAEEPEAAVAAGFALVCEFGRTLEQTSADIDRIATALEKSILIEEPASVAGPHPAAPAVHDL